MRPYMYNTHPNFELLFVKKKKKQKQSKVFKQKTEEVVMQN